MHERQFLTPAEIARELAISSATVLRLIHSGHLPAIQVSERIYRVPISSLEMYKAGSLRVAEVAPMGGSQPRPKLGRGERLPTRSRGLVAPAR